MGLSIKEKFKKDNTDVIEQSVGELREALFSSAPFFAEIMTQLRFVEDKKIQTAATDGNAIYINPRFMSGLPEGQRNFVIMHELFHVILMHCLRDEGKNAQIWNIAADCVVNSFVYNFIMQLPDNRILFSVPDDICFLADADNYLVEDLYNTICSEIDLNEKWKVMLLSFGKRQQDLFVSSSKEEQEEIRQKIQAILEGASSWGNESGVVSHRILSIMAAQKRLPWKQLLRKMWVNREEEDSSYLTPERKYLHMGLIVSGWGIYESEKQLDIWAFIDSSGSIKDAVISKFLSQIYIISKELGATLNIAYWDTQVTDVYKNIKSPKKIEKCIPHNSGGTYADCIYDYLHENRIVPDAMLIFTDGYFTEVDSSKVGNLKEKTIVVIDGAGMRNHTNLGEVARL